MQHYSFCTGICVGEHRLIARHMERPSRGSSAAEKAEKAARAREELARRERTRLPETMHTHADVLRKHREMMTTTRKFTDRPHYPHIRPDGTMYLPGMMDHPIARDPRHTQRIAQKLDERFNPASKRFPRHVPQRYDELMDASRQPVIYIDATPRQRVRYNGQMGLFRETYNPMTGEVLMHEMMKSADEVREHGRKMQEEITAERMRGRPFVEDYVAGIRNEYPSIKDPRILMEIAKERKDGVARDRWMNKMLPGREALLASQQRVIDMDRQVAYKRMNFADEWKNDQDPREQYRQLSIYLKKQSDNPANAREFGYTELLKEEMKNLQKAPTILGENSEYQEDINRRMMELQERISKNLSA